MGGDPGLSEGLTVLAGITVVEAASAAVGADVGVARDAETVVASGVAVGAGVSARVGRGMGVAVAGCPDRQLASVNANKNIPTESVNRLPLRNLCRGS